MGACQPENPSFSVPGGFRTHHRIREAPRDPQEGDLSVPEDARAAGGHQLRAGGDTAGWQRPNKGVPSLSAARPPALPRERNPGSRLRPDSLAPCLRPAPRTGMASALCTPPSLSRCVGSFRGQGLNASRLSPFHDISHSVLTPQLWRQCPA